MSSLKAGSDNRGDRLNNLGLLNPDIPYGAKMSDHRIEKDSMGEMQVPANALWGASTQRALSLIHI